MCLEPTLAQPRQICPELEFYSDMTASGLMEDSPPRPEGGGLQRSPSPSAPNDCLMLKHLPASATADHLAAQIRALLYNVPDVNIPTSELPKSYGCVSFATIEEVVRFFEAFEREMPRLSANGQQVDLTIHHAGRSAQYHELQETSQNLDQFEIYTTIQPGSVLVLGHLPDGKTAYDIFEACSLVHLNMPSEDNMHILRVVNVTERRSRNPERFALVQFISLLSAAVFLQTVMSKDDYPEGFQIDHNVINCDFANWDNLKFPFKEPVGFQLNRAIPKVTYGSGTADVELYDSISCSGDQQTSPDFLAKLEPGVDFDGLIPNQHPHSLSTQEDVGSAQFRVTDSPTSIHHRGSDSATSQSLSFPSVPIELDPLAACKTSALPVHDVEETDLPPKKLPKTENHQPGKAHPILCSRCQKTYYIPAWYKKHVAKCQA